MSSVAIKVALICLVVCVAWSNGAQLTAEDQAALDAWESFVRTYNKTYPTEEEYQLRKEQFLKNYEAIGNQNKRQTLNGQSYRTGVNKFSDLSSAEFLKQHTGLVLPPLKQLALNSSAQSPMPALKVGAPANFDWRTAGNVLPAVKDQGDCGSCWAFATIATLEGAYNKKKGYLAGTFSEQHLVDCDRSYNEGCNGGWPTYAFDYIKSRGAALSSRYPYRAVQGSCRSTLASRTYSSFTRTPRTNVNDATLRDLLYTYGPLTVLIDAAPLQSYRSGILSASCSSITHAVNLVGYVTSGAGAPYYILRNSWGSNWGENGYFRLSAAKSCFIKNYVWYATY